jgi:hypothetical protein
MVRSSNSGSIMPSASMNIEWLFAALSLLITLMPLHCAAACYAHGTASHAAGSSSMPAARGRKNKIISAKNNFFIFFLLLSSRGFALYDKNKEKC